MFIITDKAKTSRGGGKLEGVGVTKDEDLNLERKLKTFTHYKV